MAGDQSEFRGLIVAGTVLAFFAVLSASIPSSLYTASSMRTLSVPDYYTLDEIFHYSSQDLINMTGTLSGLGYPDGSFAVRELDDGSGDFGGWDIDFRYYFGESSTLACSVWHMHTEWFGFVGADHAFSFVNEQGVSRETVIDVSEMELDGSGGQVTYRGTCDHTRLSVIFAYNDTVYSSFEDAWDNEGLSAFFGMSFDDENTGFNAMNLIASILFWDMPAVHWSINLLLAIPLYISIGYISLILILRAIDALPFT